MLDASAVYKMNKLVTGPAGVGVCDIRLPIGENIRAYAKSAGKAIDEMVVAVLDREYNSELIQQIREAGAATRLLLDGDVAGGIQAARGDSRIDICAGVGGSPEGIVTACGIRALGGFMQGILTPREEFERKRGAAAGLKFDYVYEMNEMVSSDNTFFVATGVTDGALLSGVKKKDDMIFTESIVIRGRSGTVRKVFAEYQASRWI
jgi:fructose-1,6-bisphosphatase II